MKDKFSKVFFIGGMLGMLGLGIVLGYYAKECEICPPEDIDFSLFWETWDVLEDKFVEPEKLKVQEMIYGAISGMIKSLNDPYTVFLNPEDTKKFKEDIEGVFEGVGMEIGIREGSLLVITPLEGTPAQKAGILPGDKILKIDETSTIDLTIDEAVSLIRGPKDTEVTLTLSREGKPEPLEFTIKRGVIKIPSLKWEILASKDESGGKGDGIAYLKIYHFSESASSDFSRVALEILRSPAKKIILDLRNNPGGYLEVAQDIAGWFLKRDQLIAIEDFGRDIKNKEYRARGNERLLDYPIVVLINQGSASGSEILAAALRDNRDIRIIGEKSFGKGSVQELEDLRGGSSLKITIANWLTPKGELITDVGLEPDIEVKMTTEDYEQDRDPQLDKAIEIIKNL